MNQQQETLNKEIEIPGKLIASISRSIGECLTNYTIYFYKQEKGFLAPEIGVTVNFDHRLPYFADSARIIKKEYMKDVSVEECLEKYQQFITQDSTDWSKKLVDIKILLVMIKHGESLWMMDEDLIQDLLQQITDIIPYLCFYVNRGGDFSYEW
jgi:hypothetical protein